jgi:hypothetical protein
MEVVDGVSEKEASRDEKEEGTDMASVVSMTEDVAATEEEMEGRSDAIAEVEAV